MRDCDVAVVGGGLLGAALAHGLAASGARTVMLDEGDDAIRTARGNFGLVWVQGKGAGMAQYAAWSLAASRAWPEFARRLREETGIDVGYHKPGGFYIAAHEAELAAHARLLESLRARTGDDEYDFELVTGDRLGRHLPGIGPAVPGASYCRHDGHVNPLQLLRALHDGFGLHGGRYLPGHRVHRIDVRGGGFDLYTHGRLPVVAAGKVVIAAGHGGSELARELDLDVPLHPVQGQIIVTERAAPSLGYPTNYVRQTDEGNFLLGASVRDVGYDQDTETGTLKSIASQCLGMFPFLRSLGIQRAWAALRIMTPDGCPVYARSPTAPGAFSFSCHSGVTLAAMHATEAARWVLDGVIPDRYRCFHPERFDVQPSVAAR